MVDRALHSCVVELSVAHADGRTGIVETTVTNLLAEPSVRGLVLNSRDISERKKLEDELAHQAFHDPLTGLANRALFQDRVEHALRRWQDAARSASCSSTSTASRRSTTAWATPPATCCSARSLSGCRSCVRHGDTVGRFGGDEFAVLIEDVDARRRRAAGRPNASRAVQRRSSSTGARSRSAPASASR